MKAIAAVLIAGAVSASLAVALLPRRSAVARWANSAALDVNRATIIRWESGASPVAHPGMVRWALHGLAAERIG